MKDPVTYFFMEFVVYGVLDCRTELGFCYLDLIATNTIM